MTQISRPFQIALLAMVVLAGVWFFALQGHSSSGGSSSTPAPAPSAPTAAAPAKGAGAATPIYHGAAPGVEGLSRAIANAHKAVATSEQNAKQLAEKSASASNQSPTATSTPTATTKAPVTVHKVTVHTVNKQATTTHKVTVVKATTTPAAGANSTATALPKMQVVVEGELKQGKIVAILFWNPKASVDVSVQKELQSVGRSLGGKIAVHDAPASQVGSFGTITHSIQVYQTPTILLLSKTGQTTTVAGLTDKFALKQAIAEVQHP
jgi:hypothetical protein